MTATKYVDTKSKWFDKCTSCGKKKMLATIQLFGKGMYSLTLRRMCEDCRSKVLFHFYMGLGWNDTAEIFGKNMKK